MKEKNRLKNLYLQNLLSEVHLNVSANNKIVRLVKKSKNYTVKKIKARVITILLNNEWTQQEKWNQVRAIYEKVRANECGTTECDDDEEPYLFKPKCTNLRF